MYHNIKRYLHNKNVILYARRAERNGGIMKKLYRSSVDKMICGVCGGLAEYFNIDSTIVRLATVVLACVSLGTCVLAYIVAAIIIPQV